MIYLALVPLAGLAHTFILWVFYLAVMNLQAVRDAGKLPPAALGWGEAALYVGLFFDLTYNWTWAVLLFLDWPREPLVTGRLIRYKFGAIPATGWRLRLTEWFAKNLLDPYTSDPRGHIHD